MRLPSEVTNAGDYRDALTAIYVWLGRCRSKREANECLDEAVEFLDLNSDRLLAACDDDAKLAFWVGHETIGLIFLRGVRQRRGWRAEWAAYTAERPAAFKLLREDTLSRARRRTGDGSRPGVELRSFASSP